MNNHGLSLLEVMVGLAIIALLLAVTLPSLSDRSGLALELAARRVAGDLRRAQSQAVRHSHTVDFAVNVASGVFGHERLDRILESRRDIGVALFTTADQRRNLQEGTIRFFPEGGSTGGGIVLSQGPRRIQVLVDWLTGRVSINRSFEEANR